MKSENSLEALVLEFRPRPVQSAGCVELDCTGLGGQIALLEWKVTGRLCSWNLSCSTVQSLLEQFIIRIYSHDLRVTLNFNATYSTLSYA